MYLAEKPDAAAGDITAGVIPFMEGGVLPAVPEVTGSTPVLASTASYVVTLEVDGDITVAPDTATIP